MFSKMINSIKNFFIRAKDKIVHFIKNFDPRKYYRLYLGVVLILAICFFAYLLLKHYGILDKFSSVDEIAAMLNSKYKVWTVLLYMLVQFMQVSFIPIPAFITTAAGIAIFNNWYEPVIYSLIAIISASIFSFALGRWFGKPFVSYVVGRDNMQQYLKKTKGKERPVFFMMFLLPLFPDDILCMVAGITTMSYRFFIIMQLLTRPPAVIGTILTVYGVVDKSILTTPWGIVLAVLLAIGFIAAVYLSIKYAEQIEKFFVRKFSRKNKIEDYVRHNKRANVLEFYNQMESSEDLNAD